MELFASLLLSLFAALTPGDRNWGDQGDGTYINPVLNADYSDPDVIRVGRKFYMVASDFHFVGMQILESDDMVNWTVVTQIFDRFDLPGWDSNSHYAGGSWAPSLRYHDGRFWVYFCTPDEGLFMTTAKRARGPWEPLCHVRDVRKWEDPCPVWDDEGNAYLGRSAHGAGPIILHRMSADGRTLLDEGDTIYQGPVAEGTKFYRKDGWWYLIIPEGGVGTGWQTALRSKNLYGPYERRIVLEQGSTDINGPHQGALVQGLANDEWWFYHFQEKHPMGRVVHLQPAHWEDGWPVIGTDYDGNGIGEPVYRHSKPSLDSPRLMKRSKVRLPQTSDSFKRRKLSPQWQFCHNPHDAFWSLKEKRGWLTIHAQKSGTLMMAHNMLTQKCMGWSGQVTTVFDASAMEDGQRAGLLCMGQSFYGLGLLKENGRLYLYSDVMFRAQKIKEYTGTTICVSIKYDAVDNRFQYLCGPEADALEPVGQPFSQRNGNWKGCRFGLYTYNTEEDAGLVRFDSFDYPVRHSGYPEPDSLNQVKH